MDNDNHPYGSFEGQWVWKMITLPKIKCFLWLCLHKSISVREVLAARGLNVPLCCPICNSAMESILHMLRDYPQVRAFWDSFPPPIHLTYFMVQTSRIGSKSTAHPTRLLVLALVGELFFPLEFGVYGYGRTR